MFGIAALLKSVANLAKALAGLAATADEVNLRARARLRLDGPGRKALPAPAEANGKAKARKAVAPSRNSSSG